jgi:hypothetical protein
MTKENQNKQSKVGQQEVKIADNIAGAEYANMMQVLHNREEMNLLFAHILPPSGKMVAKITTPPSHFKRMIEVMENALKIYEEQFGKIDTAQDPKTNNEKVGF